jgi:hypothetical protein
MEEKSQEPPRRVTPTEARAKLLRSLVSASEQRMKAADREKLEHLQISFLLEMADQQ